MAKKSKGESAMAWALKSGDAVRLRAMIEVARSEAAAVPNDFDQDNWLLNCANGTVDLKTGILREHSAADFITKLCPTKYEPKAEAPTWEKFLSEVFKDDKELIVFVQRLLGYCLTGDVRE